MPRGRRVEGTSGHAQDRERQAPATRPRQISMIPAAPTRRRRGRRLDYRAVWCLVLGRSRLEDDGSTFEPANAPQSPSTSYEHADRKLAGVPSELDVPVGKTEPEDPIRAVVPSSNEYFSLALPDVGGRTLASHVCCSFFDELDPHDHRPSVRRGSDSPKFALTTESCRRRSEEDAAQGH